MSSTLPTAVVSVAVLAFTALVAAVFNLDVAAVVATPLAVRVATQRGLCPGRLVVRTALTANATSFLLPTSKVTTLLVLNGSTMSAAAYLREGWLAWLLVSIITVGLLALSNRKSCPGMTPLTPKATRPIVPTILDLVPMFVIASAIHDVLGGGLYIHGAFLTVFAEASVLAAAANNLPVAAGVPTAAVGVPWAVVWAMAIGPNLLVTGSVATIICRRTALNLGVRFESSRFTMLGAVLLPVQFGVAYVGLTIIRIA